MGSLLVPHAALSAALARRYVVQDVLARGAAADVVDDAALVVSELVGNAVRHGPAASGGGIRVTWEVDGDVLRIEVAAGGRGPSSSGVRSPIGSSDDESGRGLAIVATLTRAWGVRADHDGNVVWAELPLAAVDEVTAHHYQADSYQADSYQAHRYEGHAYEENGHQQLAQQ